MALRTATAEVRSTVAVEVLVVLDGCRDGSAAVAGGAGVRALTVEHRNVGAARRSGFGAPPSPTPPDQGRPRP